MVKFEKKGAVELSLNLIIMLVIGLTVMGLVIAFVTNFLGSAEGDFESSLGGDNTAKLEQTEALSGTLAFLSREVSFNQETIGQLYMKVRSSGSNDIEITTDLTDPESPIKIEVTAGYVENEQGVVGADINTFSFITKPETLEVGDSSSFEVQVRAGETPPGTYYAKFTLFDGSSTDVLASETVTITVR